MEYTLNMVFATSGGKNVTFSISHVKSTLTQTQAKALMDSMIAKNIFTTSSGDLISKVSAALVKKEVTDFEVV
jgi:hypothetical protein